MAEQAWRTPEAVRAWLEQQPEGAVVGLKGRYAGCTLSRCYEALSGHVVGLTTLVVDVAESENHHVEEYPAFEFEVRFMVAHDEHDVDHYRTGDPVTRERALEILNAVAPVSA